MSSETDVRSYHGQPVIKQPVWNWEIPTYFYTGGLAGASAGLALAARIRGEEVLERRAWATALAGITASPPLLVSDLGVPVRFINMLRMFKVTSPMSVGSWILSASGMTTAVAALNAWTGLLAGPARIARPAAAVLGLPLSTYTAALIANTAVPVWHEGRQELPFVFGAGAALSAGAAAVIATPTDRAAPARRLALAGGLLEVAAKKVMRRRLGEHGSPYGDGDAKQWGTVSDACIAVGAALLGTRGRGSRLAACAAGALLSGGALSARWSVFTAGVQSAADPRSVIGPQRERIESGASAGAARSEPRVVASASEPQTAGS